MSFTVALVGAGLLAGAWLMWRVTTPPPATVPSRAGRATLVVPARDEEVALPRLLASLAAQATAPHEVVVVDDGSTDRTALVARQAGVPVLTALAPPKGWIGKPWACHTGANAASGSLLVFLDADTELGPDGLDRLLTAHASLAPDGLLSVQPFHRTIRAYEQLSAFCNIVSMMASGAFRPRAQPTSNVAFGPCLVVSSSAYRRAGGHAAVAGQVIEDVHMAHAHRRIAQPVACLAGGTAISFRMYPSGIRQLAQGWTKNLAGGVRLVSPLPMLGAVLWVTACAAVAVSGAAAAWHGSQGLSRALPIVGWMLVAAQVRWILRRIGSFRWWTAPAFPIPLIAFLVLFTSSVLHRSVHRSVRWRGRDIDLGQMVS